MFYASIFVIKEFFKQWRPSTAKSKHSIAIRLILLIKWENNKANIPDYPPAISCVPEVVFGGKNCKLIAFSPETSRWAGQLLTIIATFPPRISNLRSSSRNHSKSVRSTHTFFWDRYLQGRLRTCLKHHGLADFLITNIKIFSPRALDAAIPVNRTLKCFPPELRLLRKCKDFDGSTS